MTRTFRFVAAMASVLWAVPVMAQAPSAPAPRSTEPTINFAYVGGNIGLAVVEKASVAGGVDAGTRVWRNLDAIGELTWAGNVVTGRQTTRAANLAGAIGATHGGQSEGSVKGSGLYLGLGARWVFENIQFSGFRPYVLGTVGGGRVALDPSFVFNGTNITDTIAQYGVTLGKDLAGAYWHNAFTAGVGAVKGYNAWYFDGSIRVTSIDGIGQRSNVARIAVGGGRRF
jgi:hypothetical protein